MGWLTAASLEEPTVSVGSIWCDSLGPATYQRLHKSQAALAAHSSDRCEPQGGHSPLRETNKTTIRDVTSATDHE